MNEGKRSTKSQKERQKAKKIMRGEKEGQNDERNKKRVRQ